MGRSYTFECCKCGYRARVSGRADEGVSFAVQTILCRDCRELYDVVIRARVPDEPEESGSASGSAGARFLNPSRTAAGSPAFQSVLNRLPFTGARQFKWLSFQNSCPVSRLHHVRSWNEPDKCPRCGVYLEKNAVPYRIWE